MKRLMDMTEPETTKYFSMLAEFIEACMPGENTPGSGHNGRALFMLIVVDNPGLGHYVSNCRREDMIKALRETADRLERHETNERAPFQG